MLFVNLTKALFSTETVDNPGLIDVLPNNFSHLRAHGEFLYKHCLCGFECLNSGGKFFVQKGICHVFRGVGWIVSVVFGPSQLESILCKGVGGNAECPDEAIQITISD